MNYKDFLFYTTSVIWESLVLIQQVYWIRDGNYSFIDFIWGVIGLLIPYIIYKSVIED